MNVSTMHDCLQSVSCIKLFWLNCLFVCVKKAKYLSRLRQERGKILASKFVQAWKSHSSPERKAKTKKMERGPYKLSDFGWWSMKEKTWSYFAQSRCFFGESGAQGENELYVAHTSKRNHRLYIKKSHSLYLLTLCMQRVTFIE